MNEMNLVAAIIACGGMIFVGWVGVELKNLGLILLSLANGILMIVNLSIYFQWM